MKEMIADLVLNADSTSFYFLPEPITVRKSKKDKDYACLKLQDKSGIIDARLWDIPPGLDVNSIKKGSIVKVRGTVSEWQDVKQLSIANIRLVQESDEVDLGDFFEKAERPAGEMWDELSEILANNLTNKHIIELTNNLFKEHKEAFCKAPAAKSVHHCFISGLLEHSVSLCKTAVLISNRYNLNMDLMLFGCIGHDLGKIKELSYEAGINYTVEGSLIGHLAISMMLISEAINKIDGFPKDLKIAVLHLIAAHHGLLEFGSVKTPLMREALAFHQLDMLDSRLGICDRALKKGVNELNMTEWVKELSGPLWKGPWQDSAENSTAN